MGSQRGLDGGTTPKIEFLLMISKMDPTCLASDQCEALSSIKSLFPSPMSEEWWLDSKKILELYRHPNQFAWHGSSLYHFEKAYRGNGDYGRSHKVDCKREFLPIFVGKILKPLFPLPRKLVILQRECL